MNKKHLIALAALVLLAISGVAAGAAQATTNIGFDSHATGIGVIPLSPMSQENAVRAANDYLRDQGFSREGLIEQLEHDEYSAEDATFAVDSITVDWNAQAAKVAKEYLRDQGFSHGELIEQLEHDGFTSSQAQYGVAAAGL